MTTFKRRFVAVVLLALMTPFSYAQDAATETSPPLATEEVVATLPPTLTPDPTVPATEVSSVTPDPTITPTVSPSEDVSTPAESATLPQTPPSEVTTALTSSTTTALPPTTTEAAPAVLPLAYSAAFESGISAELSAVGWIVVSVPNGSALQTGSSASPVIYTAATFTEAAVEARFLLSTGEGSLFLGHLSAAVRPDGLITLSRDANTLATYQASLTAGTWITLRLQRAGGMIHVSLDNTPVIVYTDDLPLVAGNTGFAVSTDAVLRLDDFAVYGTPVVTMTPVPTESSPIALPPVSLPNMPQMPLPQSGEEITLVGSNTLTDRITFTWNDVTNDVGYRLMYSPDGVTFYNNSEATNQDVTTYDVTTSACSEIVVYRVYPILNTSPFTLGNRSSIGVGSRACPLETLALGLPLNGTVTEDNSPLLAWSGVENTTAYEIEVSPSSTFASFVEGYPQDVTAAHHTPAALPDGLYYWRVRAKTPHNGAFTEARSFTVQPVQPPANFDVTTQNDDLININWNYSHKHDGYLLEQSFDNINWTMLAALPYASQSYQLTSLPCSYRVYVRISSIINDPYRQSEPATRLGKTNLCPISGMSPSNGTTFNSATLPTLAWDAVLNTTSYELTISRDSAFGFNGNIIGYPITVTSNNYTTNALPNGVYYWRVRQKTPDLATFYSSTGTFTNSGKPSPLTPIGISVTDNLIGKVRLTWSHTENEGGYFIEQSADYITWTPLATVGPNIIAYDDIRSTLCGMSPYYRIRTISDSNSELTFPPTPYALRGKFVCPTLEGPAQDAILKTNFISLTWSRSAGTLSYEVDLSTSPTFDTSLSGYPRVVPIDPNVTGTSFTFRPDILTAGTYYWRVRTKTPHESGYTTARRFYINIASMPDAPVPMLPNDIVVLRSTQPTFTWQPVPDITYYEFEVDDDVNFGSIHYRQTTTLPTVILASPMSINFRQGRQYWRVRSVSSSSSLSEVYSLWSTPQAFTINPMLRPVDRSAFTPLAGAAGANVVFAWAAAADVMFPLTSPMYRVQVDDDPAFTSVNHTCVSNVMSVRTCTITGIPFGAYHWRVIRSDEALPAVPVFNRFSVSPAAPRAPLLTQPANTRILPPAERPSVQLAWSWGTLPVPAGGSFTYDVEINTNSLFNTEMTDAAQGLTDPTHTTIPLPDGRYFWRVRAVNTYGVRGAWSAPLSFTVDSQPPAPPLITTPLLNASAATGRPVISWTASVGAVRYEVEINDTCDDGTPIHTSPLVALTTYTPATHVLSQGAYVVCVRAYDAAGNVSALSAPRPFTVFLGLTPAANAFLPLTTRPTFTWAAVPGTTGYTLQIDTDNDWTTNTAASYTAALGAVTTHTLPLPTTLSEGLYYWRVVRTGEIFTSSVSRMLYMGALRTGPVLTAPLASTFIKSPTMLTWDAATAPTGAAITAYQVEVSRVLTFVPLLSSTSVVLPNMLEVPFTPAVNLNGVRHYWRVRALVNGAPVTSWTTSSFIVDNVTPLMPTITSPLPNALLNTVRPTLTWAAVPTASRYTVAVKDAITDTDVVPEQTVTTLSLPLTVNLPQSDLILRVRAEDSINQSEWRTVSFRVRLGTLPAQNAIVTTRTPVFTWLAVPGATSYTLQIDNDMLFDGTADDYPTQTIPLANVLTYTLNAAQQLTDSGVYYWRVMTNNVPYPADSGVRTFYYTTPIATKPLTATLATLANGTTPSVLFNQAIYGAGGVTFTWGGVTPTPLLYEVQISSALTFPTAATASHISPTADPSLVLTGGQLTDGLKYWRVRALYSADRTSFGLWSDPKTFTLDQVAPSAPLIPSTMLSAQSSNRPLFVWTPVAGAVRYRLTVVGTSINDLPVTTTSYRIPPTLPPLTQNNRAGYTWFVQAEDAAGNRSVPSLNHNFTVFVGVSPTSAQFIADSTPLLTWTPVTGVGAANWTLEIATDSAMTNLVMTPLVLPATAASVTLPNALSNGLYFWRVYRAGEALTDLSGQPFYVASIVAQMTPVVHYPLNNAVIGGPELDEGLYIQWEAFPIMPTHFLNAYLFEISTVPTFATLTDFLIVTDNLYDPVKAILWSDLPLEHGKTYYWRMRGLFRRTPLPANPQYADFLTTIPGPASPVRTIRIDLLPPAAPVPTLPVMNALITTPTPTFAWAAALGAARYRVEISTSPTFDTISRTMTVAAPAVSGALPLHLALPNGTYYWRVVALDSAFNASPPSAARRFIVAVP